jgi:membrane protein
LKKWFTKLYNFFNDDIAYHSASLSFYTIFSILPLLALLIVIISSFSSFEQQTNLLMSYIIDFINPTHSETISKFLDQFLQNTDKLGPIGIFYLLFVFTIFFRDYEHIINKIYNTQTRALYKLFFLYLSFLILIPILFISYILISTFLTFTFSGYIFAFLFLWFLFITLFIMSANTKVKFFAAAVSSLVTIAALSITKSLFGYYVNANTTYTTIYGSFSVILFFFLWIYISWNIYLYGTKICCVLNQREPKNEI